MFYNFHSAHSRSPSPDTLTDSWQMETDAALAEIQGDKPALPNQLKKDDEKAEVALVTKLSTKLNGTVVTPKKAASKGNTGRTSDCTYSQVVTTPKKITIQERWS